MSRAAVVTPPPFSCPLLEVVVDTLHAGEHLAIGGELRSGVFQFVLQGDGNLVLYRLDTHRALWASSTVGKGAASLDMQPDGNLVLYSASRRPLWASGTNGKGADRVVLQGDGNLVAYTPAGRAVWSTNTWQADVISSTAAAATAAAGGKIPAGLDQLAYYGHTLSELTPEAVEELKTHVRRVHALCNPFTGEQLDVDHFGGWTLAAPGPDGEQWDLSHDGGTRQASGLAILARFDNLGARIGKHHVGMEGGGLLGTLVDVVEAIPALAVAPIAAPTLALASVASDPTHPADLFTDTAEWSATHPLETIAITAAAAGAAYGGAAAIGAYGAAGVASGAGAVATGAGAGARLDGALGDPLGLNGSPPQQAAAAATTPPADATGASSDSIVLLVVIGAIVALAVL